MKLCIEVMTHQAYHVCQAVGYDGMIGMILIRAFYLLKPGSWIDPVCLESLDEVGNAVIGDNGCATDLDRQVDKIPLFGVAAD